MISGFMDISFHFQIVISHINRRLRGADQNAGGLMQARGLPPCPASREAGMSSNLRAIMDRS
jgi:hypothetical protein